MSLSAIRMLCVGCKNYSQMTNTSKAQRDREPNDDGDDIWFWCIAWHHCRCPCSALNLIKKDPRNAIHTKVAYFSLFLSKEEFVVMLMGCGNGAHFLCFTGKQLPKSFGLLLFSRSVALLFYAFAFCFFFVSSDQFLIQMNTDVKPSESLPAHTLRAVKNCCTTMATMSRKKWTFCVKCVSLQSNEVK